MSRTILNMPKCLTELPFESNIIKTPSEEYTSTLLKFHVSEQLCSKNRTHADNRDFRE
jgi:hypothetical protein